MRKSVYCLKTNIRHKSSITVYCLIIKFSNSCWSNQRIGSKVGFAAGNLKRDVLLLTVD